MKKQEKEFNARFKVTFITVVSYHMIMEARTMKVIDMTNTEALKRQYKGGELSRGSPHSRKSSKSRSKSPHHRNSKVSQLDLDFIADERAIIPKPLLTYQKPLIVHTQRINERNRRQGMREEMLRVAKNNIMAKQMAMMNAANQMTSHSLI